MGFVVCMGMLIVIFFYLFIQLILEKLYLYSCLPTNSKFYLFKEEETILYTNHFGFIELLGFNLRGTSNQQNDAELLTSINTIIDEYDHTKRITVEKLSLLTGISPYKLSRCTKRLTQLKAQDYIHLQYQNKQLSLP